MAGDLIPPLRAEALIREHFPAFSSENVDLEEAQGRILREDLHADRELPPYDRAAMDGIAFSSAEVAAGRREFAVVGFQPAGRPASRLPAGEGSCHEIATGAVLPIGADSVAPYERIALRDGRAAFEEGFTPGPWANVHRRGSDAARGARLVSSGMLLTSPEIAVAASIGKARLRVARKPVIGFVSTGDEIVAVEQAPLAHQIRGSNGPALAAALRRFGYSLSKKMHLPDEPEALRRGIGALLQSCEVLILSGAVSAGRTDLVPAALEACGARRVFHGVAQRPGKPFWFGTGPAGRPIFSLPGNPVSVLVCLYRYVLPALENASGLSDLANETAELASDYEVKAKLAFFLPVRIESRAGRLLAHPQPPNGSGDFAGLAGTSGFVELQPGPNRVAAGTAVPLYRW